MANIIPEETEANAVKVLRDLGAAVELAPNGEIVSVDSVALADVARRAQGVLMAVDALARERAEESIVKSS